MTLATELVQNYRLALRTLWTTYYWSNPAFRDYQSVRDFEKAELVLFRGLVARRLEPLGITSDEIFGSSFRVVPAFTDPTYSGNHGPNRNREYAKLPVE